MTTDIKNWSGTSMEELYENSDPYSFSITPVTACQQHAVLYELPVTLTTPPKPHRNTQIFHWDKNHVKMPYSPQNLFPVKDENGEEILQNRWQVIKNSLLQPITTSRELEAAINNYNSRLPKFTALHHLFEEVLDEDEGAVFFKTLLPGIIQLALQLPEILPGNLPLLQMENSCSVSLSQMQIASLLANGFLCTLPWRKEVSNTYPGANFAKLFSAHIRPKRLNCVTEKIKAICHYFRRVLTKMPVGVVTFERKILKKHQFPRWDKLDNNLGNTKVHISSTGTIENNGHGLLQVDFANKFVGGGVLGYGCVQEEIRYVICPELIISRLFTEELGMHEALLIIGPERYSNYSGYGDSFTWEGDYVDQTPHDCYGRRKTSVVAIDALHFNKSSEQFGSKKILRELNKAYVGFHTNCSGKLAPVATGNWGCGAFKGDPRLKSLIQLMACSAARRNMVYYTFGDSDLEKTIYGVYSFLANNNVTVCDLWRILRQFVVSETNPDKFIPFIQQAYFDLRSQPSIKQFFGELKKSSTNQSEATTSSSKSVVSSSGTWPIKYSKNLSNKKPNIPTTSTSTENFLEHNVNRNRPKSVQNENRDELSEDREAKKTQCANVIDLIKIIDGNTNSNNEGTNVEQSLLSSIDHYCGNNVKNTERNVKSSDVCIDMDVDVETPVEKNRINPKRKISDYFVKSSK